MKKDTLTIEHKHIYLTCIAAAIFIQRRADEKGGEDNDVGFKHGRQKAIDLMGVEDAISPETADMQQEYIDRPQSGSRPPKGIIKNNSAEIIGRYTRAYDEIMKMSSLAQRIIEKKYLLFNGDGNKCVAAWFLAKDGGLSKGKWRDKVKDVINEALGAVK